MPPSPHIPGPAPLTPIPPSPPQPRAQECTVQSNAVTIRARVYAAPHPLDPHSQGELIADVAFENAGLEFGGAYRCGA